VERDATETPFSLKAASARTVVEFRGLIHNDGGGSTGAEETDA
jgi:hypothetical protein